MGMITAPLSAAFIPEMPSAQSTYNDAVHAVCRVSLSFDRESFEEAPQRAPPEFLKIKHSIGP